MSKIKILLSIIVISVMLGTGSICVAEMGGFPLTPPTNYIYVRNVSGHTIENGEIVMWASASTAGLGYEITQCEGSSVALVAGIAAQDIPNNNYGNILVSGYHEAVKVDTQYGSIAVGEGLIPSGQYLLKGNKNVTSWNQIVALEAEVTHFSDDSVGAPSDYAQDAASPPTIKAFIRLY